MDGARDHFIRQPGTEAQALVKDYAFILLETGSPEVQGRFRRLLYCCWKGQSDDSSFVRQSNGGLELF